MTDTRPGMYEWGLCAKHVFESAGLTPDPWQEHALMLDEPRYLIIAPRQSGKSTVAAAIALSRACRVGSSACDSVMIVSPSQRQSNLLLARIREIIRVARNGTVIDSDREDRVRLNNGVTIQALPDNPDTICGNTARFVILDEAARISEPGWTTAIACTVASKGGVLAISTGTHQHTAFFRASQTWPSTVVDWRQCPRLTEKSVREMKDTMAAGVFKAEFEGGFYDEDSRQVFQIEPPSGAPLDFLGPAFGGIDWGFRDPTAALWGVQRADGHFLIMGEFYQRGASVGEVATALPRNAMYYSDPANPRERYDLLRAGFKVRQAANSIETGFRQIAWMLSQGKLSAVPGCCPNLLREMRALSYRLKPHGVVSQNQRLALTTGDDHAIAALRYLTLGLPRSHDQATPPPGERLWDQPELWTKIQ